MKKLNLEKLKLAAEEVLERNQMTTIYGGSGSGDCSNNACNAGLTCCEPSIYWCSGPSGHCVRRPGA